MLVEFVVMAVFAVSVDGRMGGWVGGRVGRWAHPNACLYQPHCRSNSCRDPDEDAARHGLTRLIHTIEPAAKRSKHNITQHIF